MTFNKKIIYALSLAAIAGTMIASAQSATTTATVTIATSTTIMATSTPIVITVATNTNATVTMASATLISTYNSLGKKGDEVLKLQSFLNSYECENLPTTGNYHKLTQAAVKRFQSKYGIKETGIQHEKTTAKINEIYSNDKYKFVLAKKMIYIPSTISIKMDKSINKNIVSNTKIVNTENIANLKSTTTIVMGVDTAQTNIINKAALMSSSAKDVVSKTGSKFVDMFKNLSWLLWIIPILLILFFARAIYNIFIGGSNKLLTGIYAKDDIEKIEGIGPKLRQDLYEFNVTSFEQLSKLSTDKVKGLFIKKYGQFNDSSVYTWGEQATLLYKGQIAEFEELIKNLKGGRR
jgi:peptidoglycan hydrolase-like protein with peptidoglycan-binding domain